MVRAPPHQVFLFLILFGMAELDIFSKADSNTWTCEKYWFPFETKGEISCLRLEKAKSYFRDAHADCSRSNSSVVAIHSREKDDFLLGLMKKETIDSMFIGLTTLPEDNNYELRWLRYNGNEKVDYSNFRYNPDLEGSRMCSWKFGGHGAWVVQNCPSRSYSTYPYYCEKRPLCALGTFGKLCDKRCHCHGQPCDPRDLSGSCRFGCERGWMGIGCDKRKEDADVTYYCVNSRDHGTYVSIMINTKGVDYRNIHGLDAEGKPAPWCNDTTLIIGRPKDFVDIKIFKSKANQEGLNAGICAGKILDENTYQWTLMIQERKGILMDNDQSLLITCNFTDAETLTRDGHDDVKEENETPVHTLQQTREEVKLEVADAFTGKVLTQTKTGSPVRLQICFGLQEGSLVKGVVPYDCEAVSGDGKQRQPLLDKNGCQEADLVSPFRKSNVSHVIQTDWFPFFGFEGSSVVQLRCSFTFCFVDCKTGCDPLRHNSNHSGHRSRRDTQSLRDLHHSVVRRIEILPVTVAGAEEHHIRPKKPVATVPKDKEKEIVTVTVTEPESEPSFFMQWTSYTWFFIFFNIIFVIVILAVYIISTWAIHSSITSIKRDIKSSLYREGFSTVAFSD